ncbi:MAG: hypothetical protein J4F35_10390 [Candidatus Latescibacteria bacterium]|nr:hypothetical protein [Candidatus Latescibacterota bacterium]
MVRRRIAPQQRVVLRVEVIHAAVVGIGDDLVELVVVDVEDEHAGHRPFEIVAVPHLGIGAVALLIDVESAIVVAEHEAIWAFARRQALDIVEFV